MANDNRSRRALVGERDGWYCQYCYRSLTLNASHLEHVVPLARGGPDQLHNCVLACPPCNRAKKDRDPVDWWLDLQEKGTEHFYPGVRAMLRDDLDVDPRRVALRAAGPTPYNGPEPYPKPEPEPVAFGECLDQLLAHLEELYSR